MKNLTPELIEKAKTAKSAEELLELAKANDVEITEDMAKIYFDQLNSSSVLSDEELDAVSGGEDKDCNFFKKSEDTPTKPIFVKCHNCGRDVSRGNRCKFCSAIN